MLGFRWLLCEGLYEEVNFLSVQYIEGNAFLDDKEYLIEQVGVVGKIIIDCAQNGKKWEVLTDDEQELIIDFANIFKKQSLERASQLVEVAA